MAWKIKRDWLDDLFSEYIRKRAILRVGGCERCGAGKASYKELQCMHNHGRGKQSVRFDPDNALGGCYGCHSHIDSQHTAKEQLFREKLGDKRYEALEARALIKGKPDRKMVSMWLRAKIKKMGYVQ